uniref:IU_nuc_hydro domain-containing protein n=1 Tax=Steinernema glaseri TaxID=37863 RepID=A0A1I7ZS52_9BILA
MHEKTKLVIDTDGITDDIRAITIASQNPGAELIAVTTVRGCISVDQATANVSRTLRANEKKVILKT